MHAYMHTKKQVRVDTWGQTNETFYHHDRGGNSFQGKFPENIWEMKWILEFVEPNIQDTSEGRGCSVQL